MAANGRVGAEVQLPADAEARTGEPKILYTVREAGTLLSLGESKTRELVAAGEIASVRVGRKVLVPRRELERYVERLKMGEA